MDYQTINPATEELVKTFPTISDADLETSIARAYELYRDDWSDRPVADRCRILGHAAKILREKTEEYASYLGLEVGKLPASCTGEVKLVAGILDYYEKNAEAFLAPKRVPGFPNAEVISRPQGIVLAIEPWNFPYYQVVRVAAPQLAVGNVVIMKHSENVPQCALAFARLMREAGAPEGAYTNIFATREQIARVIADPRIIGVTLTGSERAGASVGELAGRNLKKIVLELGGSDPLIVMPDAPLEDAVKAAVYGRTFNNAESCINTKRVIVVGKDRGAAFTKAFTAAMKALKVGAPSEAGAQLGPVISEKALAGLLDQIDQARKGGATILTGGKRVDRPGYFLEPTVLADIGANNSIYRQELFGPVASVFVVGTVNEAIRIANDNPFGLGSSVFGADLDQARSVADQIESGMVFINQTTWTTAQLPFGGVKRSGFGRELSELGIGEFINHKLIHLAPSGSPPSGPIDAKPKG
jgi:succinate-semialdehyde dehydrogenase / glutarate-semialdehyde dehydrogenase